MSAPSERKISLTLDAAALDAARELGINVSAVAETALQRAVAEARLRQWLDENAEAFAAQSEWHKRNGHPAADIMVSPGADFWRD